MSNVMLTTIDNPFNPFTEFNDWYNFDVTEQHFSSQLLARVARVSDGLTDLQNDQEIERAIDIIVEMNPIYKKAVKGEHTPRPVSID